MKECEKTVTKMQSVETCGNHFSHNYNIHLLFTAVTEVQIVKKTLEKRFQQVNIDTTTMVYSLYIDNTSR